MDKMRLVIHSFEEYRENLPLWSVICVNVSDQYFPYEQWLDATSSILQMWLSNIICLVEGSTDKSTLYFMDGDYRIELRLAQCDSISVECIAPGNEITMQATVDVCHFARQILAAVERMKNNYSDYLDSRVFQELTYKTTQLRKALQKYS